MKVFCALVVLLSMMAVAVHGEEMGVAAVAENAPFVPQAFDEEAEMSGDMDADTAEEEVLDADETADNDEGEDESESEAEGDAADSFEDAAEEDAEADDQAAAEFEQEDEDVAEDESEEEGEQEAEEEGTEFSSFAEVDSETDAEGKPRRMGKPKRGPAKRRPIIAPVAIAKPVKFHSERIVARDRANKYEDPEMAKLNLALDAVKEDILSTNKQITDERKWVIAVAKIIASYNDKMKRVEAHIIALRKEMKALYRKKKQIENLKLQKALEAKLKEARDELATLTNSLKHVAVKQGELNRSGADLRQTIAGIQSQLAKLRGQQLKKPRPAVKGGKRGRKGGKGRRGARKGRRGGKRRCAKGQRFSRRARKCVAAKRK